MNGFLNYLYFSHYLDYRRQTQVEKIELTIVLHSQNQSVVVYQPSFASQKFDGPLKIFINRVKVVLVPPVTILRMVLPGNFMGHKTAGGAS